MCGTVVSKEWLTPNMVRIVLAGEGMSSFTPKEFTDQYIICQFPPKGAPYSVPFGAEIDQVDPALRPRARRYTVRAWDPQQRHLTVDFVTHGDEGYAGPWAQRAEPGDQLMFRGPGGDYRPDPGADWYLMAGDESALPGIAASLDVLPVGRRAVVVVVVDSPDHEVALSSPADLDVTWLHRKGSTDPAALLPATVAALPWHAGRVDVFVHGEAGEVRATRAHLIAARGVDRDAASISPYWRRDHDDEAWRAIKREWFAEQDRDV
jgi:NADPH-dependent ferric siderophore reductase